MSSVPKPVTAPRMEGCSRMGMRLGKLIEKKIVIPIAVPGNHDQQHAKKKDVQGKQHVHEGFHSN